MLSLDCILLYRIWQMQTEAPRGLNSQSVLEHHMELATEIQLSGSSYSGNCVLAKLRGPWAFLNMYLHAGKGRWCL